MLEELNKIDFALSTHEGRVQLVITDSGITVDDDERFEFLTKKATTYVAYVLGPSFATDFPGKSIADCDILVMSKRPASSEMLRFNNLANSENPSESIRILYRTFDPAAEPRLPAAAQVANEPEIRVDDLQLSFFKAYVKNDFDGLKSAVREGADVNSIDVLGKTALDFSVHHSNTEMTRFLFEKGAQFPVDSFGGRTLWVFARARKNKEIQRLMIERGATPHAFDYALALILRIRNAFKRS